MGFSFFQQNRSTAAFRQLNPIILPITVQYKVLFSVEYLLPDITQNIMYIALDQFSMGENNVVGLPVDDLLK